MLITLHVVFGTGVQFFTEVGTLTVMKSGSEYMKLQQKVADEVNIKLDKLSRDEAKEKFPYLDYKDCDEAWFEPTAAGYINPRHLVKAEQILARRYGCHVVDDVAMSVQKIAKPDGTTQMEISTEKHGKILARKVVLATGAFTEFRDLLPDGVLPDVSILTNTVILAEMSTKDQHHFR